MDRQPKENMAIIYPILDKDQNERYIITGTENPSDSQNVRDLIDERLHYFSKKEDGSFILTIYDPQPHFTG